MTNPLGTSTGRLAAAPSAGLLARLRLTEPVRLYLYGLGVVLVTGLNLAGYLLGDWHDYALSSLAVVLGLVPAAEAARASVFSIGGHVASLRQLRTYQDVQRAAGEAA